MERSEERVDKIVNWLKKPTNLLLIAIVIFAFIIRLYLFNMAVGQALWWDEAEYMSTSKMWAFNVPYNLNPQRPPLFQLLGAGAFMIGLGEGFIKFAFTLLPSLALVIAMFYLGKEMYNKKIGLIAAFLAAVSWTFLFWTARIQPDFLSMTFQVLAIMFMWQYWKNKKTKPIILAGIFSALGFYFKVSALLVPMIFMLFIFIKDRFSAFKDKNYYIYAASFLLTLIPYFIWSFLTFVTPTAFKSGYSNAIGTPMPFYWANINYFYMLTENILFILFVIGLVLGLRFLLYLDVLVKDKKKCFDANLFGVLVLLVVSAFYIFYIRGTEDRWVFLWLPFIFFYTGQALMFIYEKLKKYNKIVGVVVLLGLLLSIGYLQINHGIAITDMKKTSYLPVKLGCEWIKEHSKEGVEVLTGSYTQTVYYTERNVTQIPDGGTSKKFENYLAINEPEVMIVSIFEPHPSWLNQWIGENPDKLNAVKVYYGDEAKTQPILVVYMFNY